MIRIYGHHKGEGSFTQVTRGVRAAAAELVAGEYAFDVMSEERVFPGADARVAVVCGAPLGTIIAHRQGLHRAHWLVLAPNSNGIPPLLVQQLKQDVPSFNESGSPLERPLLTGFMAPSEWAAGVLQRTFPDHRVLVAPHGVDPSVHVASEPTHQRVAEDFREGHFRVLHFTSSAGQRKGTRELLQAWSMWRDRPRNAQLLVVAHPFSLNEYARVIAKLQLTGVALVPNPEAPAGALVASLRHAHVLCQPSRGEGFGLMPLEARSCGVPVVATTCTGHSEHMQPGDPGVIVVPCGPDAPMDDYPGATAPTVAAKDIALALEAAHAGWLKLAEAAMENASSISERWSWAAKTGPVLRRVVDDAS